MLLFFKVFNGSIFEGAPHPPSILLKLIYHWCCQTNVQNVIQWVKVDNFYVKNFFTHMRSVCIAAVHQKHEKLGGPLRRVEVCLSVSLISFIEICLCMIGKFILQILGFRHI